MKPPLTTAGALGVAVKVHDKFQVAIPASRPLARLAAQKTDIHSGQKVSVDSQLQGSLVIFRTPSSNSPVQDVNSSSIIRGTSGTTFKYKILCKHWRQDRVVVSISHRQSPVPE